MRILILIVLVVDYIALMGVSVYGGVQNLGSEPFSGPVSGFQAQADVQTWPRPKPQRTSDMYDLQPTTHPQVTYNELGAMGE